MRTRLAPIILLVVVACDGATDPVPMRTLTVVSGSDQAGGAGTQLSQPVVVRVLENGRPLPNAEVQWHAIEGGGAVSSVTSLTDAEGNASVQWMLGHDVGLQLLLATSGNGSITIRATGIFQIVSVAVGFRHACALSGVGEAFCWGANAQGQLGDGTEITRAVPTRVNTNLRFSQISAAWSHTCALTRAREAYCWGDNAVGQLGLPASISRRHAPTRVPVPNSFQDISAGFVHTCGVTDDTGSTVCWGSNGNGQLGSSSILQARTISAGEFHTCALRIDDAAWCWGWNSLGELGSNAPAGTTVTVPTPVSGSLRFTKLAAGVRHTCAIATTGVAYCWGRNAVGETGQEPLFNTPVPLPVPGTANFTAIGTGNVNTCGLSAQLAYCWGAQLGNGTTATSRTPVLVSSTLRFSALSVGYDQTCGVVNGEIWCWGAASLTPSRVAIP